MLSPLSRSLTYLTAALYALTGAVLFVLPQAMSAQFAWKVSPFVTMTIGAWCLGNAWLALITARRWQWSLVYTTLLYLGLFGVLETMILILFRDKLLLTHPIAWLYLAALGVNVIAAGWVAVEWLRTRPKIESLGPPVNRVVRALAVIFVLFVMLLGVYGLTADLSSPGTSGQIFPETMSLFTLRAFGAFYLSLALSVIPLIWARGLTAVLHHAYTSYGLLVLITVAALVFIRLFNFAAHPFQWLYLGAYLVVGVVVGYVLIRYGTGVSH